MLKIHYGGPVTGAQRFDRPQLQSDMISLLEQSNGLKMFGLRRIGESTLRLHAMEEMARRGTEVIFVDAQGMRSLDTLLFAVLGALPEKSGLAGRIMGKLTSNEGLPKALRTALGALVSNSDETGATVSAYWQVISDAIVKSLGETDTKLFLVVDEFSFLIRNMAEAKPDSARAEIDNLLASLRQWREAGLKMLLTGSIGLTGLSRKHGFNVQHLNDLENFCPSELSENEAISFVKAATHAAPDGGWTDDHTRSFVRACGVYYPCFLVKGLLAVDRKTPPAPDDFEAIFNEKVRVDLHDNFVNQFHRYFKLYREDDSDRAKKLMVPVLDAVLSRSDGCPHAELPIDDLYDPMDLEEALDVLREDGFLAVTIDANDARTWWPGSRLADIWWRHAGLSREARQ